MEERIEHYLQHKYPDRDNIKVTDLHRIHGGASRQTFRFKLSSSQDGRVSERNLILRRDPEGSLIDTERALEYSAYRSFFNTDVPVPEALFLEEDLKWLDRPFFIMEAIDDCEVASPFGISPYGEVRQKIGEQFWTILGHICGTDLDKTELREVVETPELDACWCKELDYWESVIDEDELEPNPLLRAAIRHMRRNPPAPAQRLSVVHGDYRTGNFLYDGEGTIRSILDWEMAHIGDPLEDLGWAMDGLWAYDDPDQPAGMISTNEAISLWEKASGCMVDAKSFMWWRMFACVKGLGIWISSAKEYQGGDNLDPILASAGWLTIGRHNKVLLGLLRADGGAL